MLQVNALSGFGGIVRVRGNVYVGNYGDHDLNAAGSTTTATVTLDDPNEFRSVIVLLTNVDNATTYSVSSVTINGISASLYAQGFTSMGVSNSLSSAIAIARVPEGSTVDIVVNMSESVAGGIHFTWMVVHNLISIVPSSSSFQNAGSGTSISASINSVAGGITVACAIHVEEFQPITWNLSNELSDREVSGNFAQRASAAYQLMSVTGGQLVTASGFNVAEPLCISAASFG